jgi:hypothetical protein
VCLEVKDQSHPLPEGCFSKQNMSEKNFTHFLGSKAGTVLFNSPPLKGQCHEIFDFKFSTWISFPQAPDYTIRAVQILLKIRGDIRSSRCTTSVVDTGGKWKNLFFWTPLVSRVSILINFFLQVHFKLSAF